MDAKKKKDSRHKWPNFPLFEERALLALPMDRTEPLGARNPFQKGTGLPSTSASNSAPASATSVSVWNRSLGPAPVFFKVEDLL